MKATAKYLFDEDFASGEKPTITLIEHERRRADAASQAYRNGFAAGQEQAQPEAAQRIAAALAVIADGIGRLDGALTAKLAPALLAPEPLVEISALATDCFHQLVAAPHVAARVGSGIYDTAKE